MKKIILVLLILIIVYPKNKKESNIIYIIDNFEEHLFSKVSYIEYINSIRTNYNLKTLEIDINLENSAHIRAREISNYFSHTRPDGSSFDTIIDFTTNCIGENISYNQTSLIDSIDNFMDSKPHSENILNPMYKKVGLANFNNYFVMLLSC